MQFTLVIFSTYRYIRKLLVSTKIASLFLVLKMPVSNKFVSKIKLFALSLLDTFIFLRKYNEL